jgi:hypothetical protein
MGPNTGSVQMHCDRAETVRSRKKDLQVPFVVGLDVVNSGDGIWYSYAKGGAISRSTRGDVDINVP